MSLILPTSRVCEANRCGSGTNDPCAQRSRTVGVLGVIGEHQGELVGHHEQRRHRREVMRPAQIAASYSATELNALP